MDQMLKTEGRHGSLSDRPDEVTKVLLISKKISDTSPVYHTV
jgi:hypothetical protein